MNCVSSQQFDIPLCYTPTLSFPARMGSRLTPSCFVSIRRALLLAAILLLAGTARAQPLEIAYPEEDGIEQGAGHFAFDFLRAAEMVANDSGLEIRWIPLPVVRSFHQLEQHPSGFCMGGVGITPDRKKLGKFTLPYFEDRMIGVIAPAARSPQLDKVKSLAELIGSGDYTYLAIMGANQGEHMTRTLATLGERLSRTPRNTEQMFDMLARERADFAFLPYTYAVNYLALRPDHDRFVVRTYPDMHRDFHAAFLCGSDVPDEVIARLNDAIRRQAPLIAAHFPSQTR